MRAIDMMHLNHSIVISQTIMRLIHYDVSPWVLRDLTDPRASHPPRPYMHLNQYNVIAEALAPYIRHGISYISVRSWCVSSATTTESGLEERCHYSPELLLTLTARSIRIWHSKITR